MKFQASRMQLYLKNDSGADFAVIFAKFLKTAFLQKTSGRLLFLVLVNTAFINFRNVGQYINWCFFIL